MKRVIKKIGESLYLLFYPEALIWFLSDNLQELKSYSIDKEIYNECCEKVKETRNNTVVSFIELHLTEKCNLSCKYCFIPPTERASEDFMSKNEAETILNKIIEYAEQHKVSVLVSFQGGEPLLCKECLMELIDNYRKEKLVAFTLQTNGTLIDPDFAEFIKRRGISIGVSLDGFKEVHDMQRIYANTNKGSFNDVIRGIKLLIEKNVNFGVITVITKYNVNCLDKIIDFYHNIGIKSVLLNPVEPNNPNAAKLMPDKEMLFQKYVECIEKVYNINKRCPENKIEIANVRDLLLALISDVGPRVCYMNPCGAGRKVISIDCRGNVYPCGCFEGFPEMKMGNLVSSGSTIEKLINSRPAKVLRARRVENINPCNECIYRYICGANCPSSLYYMYNDLYRPSMYCGLIPRIVEKVFQLIGREMDTNAVYYFIGPLFEEMVKKRVRENELYYYF